MLSILGKALRVALGVGLLPIAISAQEARITGRILNERGGPISGVQVRIAALGLGTLTNSDGRYTIVVPATRVHGQATAIVARLIGYTPETANITINPGAQTADFSLKSSPTILSQTVVTGEGTTTIRERLNSTVNSVDTTTLRRATEPQNVVAALAGKAPNVEVRQQAGDPGSSASIKIRGSASLTGTNEPLFVVDGQPVDNSTTSTNGGDQSTVTQNRVADINPADIESVDILKGSAASAIYGARAANGVVLITTKKGRSGVTRFTFGTTETFDQVHANAILQTNYGQGDHGVASVCNTVDCRPTRLSWGAPLTQAFDHMNELFSTGLTADNNMSIAGGNDKTLFYVSGGLTAQDGIMLGSNDKYNRATARLKASHDITTKLNVGGNFNVIDTRGNYVQKGSNVSGLLLGALRTPPDYNNADYLTASGLQRPYRFPNPSSQDAFLTAAYYDNPYFVLNNPANKSEVGRSIANANISYQWKEWLRIQNTLGGDYYNDSRLEGLPVTSAADPNGNVIRLDINNLEIDNNLTAAGTRFYKQGNIQATLTLGQNLNSRRYRSLKDFGEQLIAPEPFSLNNTVTITSEEFKSLRHIESYFGQLEGNFYDQVDVSLGLRRDGFSTFGASNQYAWFPKASIGWIFTNYMGNTSRTGRLSYGKIRFAYGQTGKEPPAYGSITALSSVATFGPGGYGDAISTKLGGQGGLVTGSTLGNDSLKPERSRETELGIDLGFLDQRADLTFTWYKKRTNDVIISELPVNASQTGAFQTVQNGASLTNEGIELQFSARPYVSQRVEWNVNFLYGRNRGNVTDLLGAEFIPYPTEGFTGAIGSSTLGYAPGVIRGKNFAVCGLGLVINGLDVDQSCGPTAAPGALYLAANGQPILDPTDRVIADPNPKAMMTFSTAVTMRGNITVSALVDVRKGGDVWNGTRGILNYFGTSRETLNRNTTNGQFGLNVLQEKYPVVAGPGAGVVAFKTPDDWQNWYNNNGGGFGPVGAQFVEDGSYTKLRELSINYNMTGNWPQRMGGFSSIDFRLAGRNLYAWTNYTGLDPEANLGGAQFLVQGLDYFNNPLMHSWVLSISLNR